MQIVDFSSPSLKSTPPFRVRIGLEILTAALIFIAPIIMLFILSQ